MITINELSIYSKIVSKGSYLIVLDTTIEYIDNNLNIKNLRKGINKNPPVMEGFEIFRNESLQICD